MYIHMYIIYFCWIQHILFSEGGGGTQLHVREGWRLLV